MVDFYYWFKLRENKCFPKKFQKNQSVGSKHHKPNSAPIRSGWHYRWRYWLYNIVRFTIANKKALKHNLFLFMYRNVKIGASAADRRIISVYKAMLIKISSYKNHVATALGCRVITVVGMCGVPWQASLSKSRRRKTEAVRETAEVGWRLPLSPCFCTVVEAHLWSSKPHNLLLRPLFSRH